MPKICCIVISPFLMHEFPPLTVQSRKAENEQKRSWWQEHIDAWCASGKAQTAYCRENDLSYYR